MTRVPFREGLFEEADGEPALTGSKCRSCGQVFFPPQPVCLNCMSDDIQPARLSRTGELYSYTIVYMPSEHFEAPYSVGWIGLPEGVRVFSQIRGWQERPLEIGMDMELYIETLWRDGENEMVGFVFRPQPGGEQV